ncbi:trypsin-like peptidase domain-containing protein [Bacillus wiedmannii]|uniref:trypsin-like peptidase domain-containing protein n=1 Tax=Bacillus wiedmannii TaxID=1890302 RepID=UPI002983BE6F|nr:trypsin-like peptidase domain-containing protein [Bacillus toyonensis]
MNDKFNKATAHVQCGGKFGTAFLISPLHAITAYHVVKRFAEGYPIDLEFSFLGDAGDRSAKLLNARQEIDTGIDLAILELDKPIEEIEPLKLVAEELTHSSPWKAYGFPSTKNRTGQIFTGEVSMFVKQHISQYDLDLNCITPKITDPKYVVFGASGSALIVDDEVVVAVLSDRMPGGTLGAVSIKLARELLNEYNITFKDNIPLITEPLKNELDKMLEMYSIRIQHYLKNSMTLPFQSELDNDLINNSYFNDFFEISTWKSKIIEHIIMITREYNSNTFIREKINKLHTICQLDLSYEEFENTMRGKNDLILGEMPDDKTTKDIRPLLLQLYSLLNKRYNKVLILTGESGSGKTHLLKTILSSNQIVKGLDYCSIRIPINVNDIKEKGFEEAIKFSLNHFLNTNFTDVTDINDFIINLERKGFKFRVIFIIDDLQTLCNSSAKFYENLKQTIVTYTKYDWIRWCLAINEFDQYLIMDNSSFLDEYCYSNDSENDANLFVSMSKINNENKVCYKILNKYDIDTKAIDQFSKKNENIKMLLNNPLISYVYANTVSENEKELHNICYFNFIKRYSDIKKTQMLDCSERDLSFQEKEVQIDNEINQIVNFLIENKKLTYPESELNDLFKSLASCYFELRSVHLVSKAIVEVEDPLQSRKDIIVKFVFKLYWAYKILLQFRSKSDWVMFPSWRKSFIELKDDLLVYEILYLDFEKKHEVLKQEIIDVLKTDNEKALLFFVGIKTSFDCQEVIFLKLLEEKELNLNKQETFGLMYFLMHTNARNTSNPQKCMVLRKYLDKVSEYELDDYLKGVCNGIFRRLSRPARLKECISEFIGCTDTSISKIIGKLAAENFARIVIEKQYRLEDFIKDNLIKFLCDNLEKIDESMKSKGKGRNSDVTFIEYFLRYLFTALIGHYNDNKILLHEILLTNKFYYFEQADDKLKSIGYILRSNSAIAYGSYYKHLHHSKKKDFKEQYISFITKLLESKLTEHRIFAFHFISNTLIDEDMNSTLDIDFIPLLKIIHEDKRIRWFNDEREAFYKRNYYPYI